MSGYTIIDVDTHVTETRTSGRVGYPNGCATQFHGSTWTLKVVSGGF